MIEKNYGTQITTQRLLPFFHKYLRLCVLGDLCGKII